MVKSPKPANAQPLLLKDPGLSAFLSWLIPGAGQLYQGRTAKGLLFMVCILGTLFYGLHLGGSQTVHAAWQPGNRRLPYVCQVGAGLATLPALVQAYRVSHGRQPLWGGFMAPPRVDPPNPHAIDDGPDEFDRIHYEKNRGYELGTVFTMIAGLLNVLVIFDALAGPAYYERRDKTPPDEGANKGAKASKTSKSSGGEPPAESSGG